jgi:hypothetical protein
MSSFSVDSTVGALNIVLAGETTEGSGVPSEILQKLPTMTYIAAKTSQENLKANIKDGDNGAHQKLDATNNSIIPPSDEGDTIEINIPGLQVGDGDEQESEDTDGQQHGQQAGDQNCERTCEICQSEYESADTVMVLPCGHFYHQLCIGNSFSHIVANFCANADRRFLASELPRCAPAQPLHKHAHFVSYSPLSVPLRAAL